MFDPFELFVGYRMMQGEFDGNTQGQDFETDLELQGWMAGGSLRF